MDPRHSMQSRGPMQSGGSMCRPEDLARAFCCSEAVFLEKNKHVDEYLKRINSEIFPFVQFGEVLVSDEGWNTRGLKFLVAHADDATFIAFRGSPNFEDLCREHIHSPLTIRDKLHGGIFELSESFMVSGCKLLLTLFIEGKRTGKRIVFCGHRLGGAVAHMVVLRFWTENGIDEIEVENCRDSMISIAFGAPNMCNIKRALEVNNNDKLKSHFFNVVHEDDPFTSSLNGPGEDVNCCIGQSVPLSSSGNAWRLFSSKKKSPNQSNVSKPWTREKFCNSYKSGVAAAKMCVSVPVANSDVKPPKLVVSSPTPKVTSAKRKASDNSGSFISIKGYNLLFLSDPVKLDGLVPWETTMQTDTEIMISAPNSTEIMDGNALSKVVLCTAFGGTTHVVTEDGTLDGVSTAVPLKSLSRIVQTFFVLATPPLCILPASKVLQDLDSIVECVPDLKDKKLSTVLRATAEGGDNLSEEDIRKNMDEMNDVVKGVIEFLTRSYILQLEKNLLPTVLKFIAGGLLFAAGMVMMPVGGFALVGGGIPVIATAVTAAGIGATVRGANVVAVSLGKGRLVVREYTEMLEVAIHEASHWSANKGLLNLDRTSTAALESALHKEVQEFGEPRKLSKDSESEVRRQSCPKLDLSSIRRP
ncbi:hypothetical protein M758_9G070600 [Ceratodon purpureus]|nr:hypothetical protein M758_9G070600 [Ceratodon purpureus]